MSYRIRRDLTVEVKIMQPLIRDAQASDYKALSSLLAEGAELHHHMKSLVIRPYRAA
jgi:hypothetical protein